MKLVKILLAALALAALSGCSAMIPSATPQDANLVMAKASRYQATGNKNLGSSKQSRTPLREGQWVATLAKSKKDPNDITLQIMKVADISANSVTLETESYAATSGAKRQVMQQRLRNFPVKAMTTYSSDEAANAFRDIEVEEIKMMDEEGKVSSMPVMPFSIGALGSELMKTNVSSGQIFRSSCATSNYSASNCMVVPYEANFLWMSTEGKTFAHSEVPIVGYLKIDSDEQDIQVIGFGQRGAKVLIR